VCGGGCGGGSDSFCGGLGGELRREGGGGAEQCYLIIMQL
jgi:hypothetical protein